MDGQMHGTTIILCEFHLKRAMDIIAGKKRPPD
jgi:hypothetical protein